MSLSALKNIDLNPGVVRQVSSLGSEKVRIWLDNLHCVTNDLSKKVTIDGAISWTPALLETYEAARRSLFGLLAGNTSEATENGWGKLVIHNKTEPAGFLVWGNATDATLLEAASDRKWPTEKLRLLGPQIGVIQGFTPASESERLLEERETEIENMIQEIEAGFAHFDNMLRKNIDLVQPHLREFVLEPGQLVEMNKQNPVKNAATVKKKNIVEVSDPRFFFYDVIDSPSEGDGGQFSGLNRKLALPQPIRANNLLTMSNVHHELIHGAQDVSKRDLMAPEDYRSFQSANASKKTNELLADECAAWAMQIEGINAISGGQLQKGMSLESAEKFLNSSPADRKLLATILGVSEIYFSSGRWKSNGVFPSGVAHIIFHAYKKFNNWFLLDELGIRRPLVDWSDIQRCGSTPQFTSNILKIVL